ncbi:MAG: S-layer homology domain-containing protein [Bacillota bacterium]
MNKLKWITRPRESVLLAFVFAFCLAAPVSAAEASTVVTVGEANGTVPGKVQVDVAGTFADASVVSVSGQGSATCAVVAEGTMEFYARQYGDYQVSATGKTVRDYWMESMRTEDMSVGTYKGTGSLEDPYTIISTFADVPMEIFKLQAAWKGYNYLAGYSTMDSPNDSDYLRSYDEGHVAALLVEDRDEQTGRLRGSFFVDGHLWVHTTGSDKGPYYMNYLLDPTDQYLTSGYALDNHYLYSDNIPTGAERREAAVQRLKAVRDTAASALFFSYRMRDFDGPIVFTGDVSQSGKFQPGDVVSIHYLLGSSDRNLFHGIKPEPAALLAQEPTFRKHYQDKGMTAVVDEEGYLAFPLYNGGYFELRNETSLKEQREVTVAPKVYQKLKITDVDEAHWAYDSITSLVDKNYMTAEGGEFLPDQVITRGEYLKALVLSSGLTIVSGKTEFADVPKSSPLSDYIFTAFNADITQGVSETFFGVDQGLSREMAAVLLCRTLDIERSTDNFTDAEDIASWAAGYPGACAAAGYLSGYPDGSYGARNLLTRAEAAVILHKVDQSKQ